MKKYLNRFLFGFLGLSMIFSAISCADEDTGGNTSSSAEVTISASKTAVELAPGASKTISVSTSGTMLAPTSSNSNVATATISNSDKTVTIKASSSVTEISTATITVPLNDSSNKLIIGVTVDPDAEVEIDNPFELTLTLSSEVAAKAASITVYAEGKEDSETASALYQTVTAEYTAGETTAVAVLDKDKANSYNYFNNIVVTVKDSDGAEIDIEYTPVYFCYTDTSFTGISVSASVSSKTFTIDFEGFTIPGGSVTGLKYSTVWASSSSNWAENTTFTPEVTVAEDGTKATFEVESTNEFYIDWTTVTVKDSSGNAVEINSGNTDANKWYSYSADVWSNTLEVVTSAGATLISSDALTITTEGTYQLAVSYDSIKDYTTVYITLAAITAWGSGSYDLPCLGTDDSTWKANTAWVDSGAFVDDNVVSSTGGYYASISPSDYTDGVYITGKTGLAGTLFVSGE